MSESSSGKPVGAWKKSMLHLVISVMVAPSGISSPQLSARQRSYAATSANMSSTAYFGRTRGAPSRITDGIRAMMLAGRNMSRTILSVGPLLPNAMTKVQSPTPRYAPRLMQSSLSSLQSSGSSTPMTTSAPEIRSPGGVSATLLENGSSIIGR